MNEEIIKATGWKIYREFQKELKVNEVVEGKCKSQMKLKTIVAALFRVCRSFEIRNCYKAKM